MEQYKKIEEFASEQGFSFPRWHTIRQEIREHRYDGSQLTLAALSAFGAGNLIKGQLIIAEGMTSQDIAPAQAVALQRARHAASWFSLNWTEAAKKTVAPVLAGSVPQKPYKPHYRTDEQVVFGASVARNRSAYILKEVERLEADVRGVIRRWEI